MKIEWNSAKMADAFDLQMGKTPDRSNAAFWNGSETWVAIGDMGESKYISSSKEMITSEAVSVSGIKRVPANTVIMSFKLSVGKVAIAKSDLYTNEAIMAFNVKPGYDILPEYVYYYLKGYKWQGSNRAVMGVTLNKASISQGNFKYPDSQEQSRIVAELDLLTGIIDKQNAQLKELDNLAQAIFYDMFGDPIENPKRWEVKPLGNIGKIVTGNTPSRLVKEYYDSPFIEWIKSDNLSNDFMYASKAKEYLSESGALKGRVLPIGSVLVTCIAGSISTIGTASSIDRKVAFNQQINAIIPNEHIVQTLYLLYTIRLMGGVIRANATNGMKHIITKSVFEKIPFILPPLALQQSFAEKIQSIEKQKETIRASIADTQKLLDYTMDKYFG